MRLIARQCRWAGVLMALAFAGGGAMAAANANAAASTPPPATRPSPSLTDALTSVGDLAHELKLIDRRLVGLERGLILLATGCVAGLIVLQALMRRWTARRDAA